MREIWFDLVSFLIGCCGAFWAGAEQARDLGIWLREHYFSELSKSGAGVQSAEKLIHLRTTNFLRTHLTGMELHFEQIWGSLFLYSCV